jgi:phage terminase small subunit
VKNITARHKRFVEAYCEHFNGAQAAREAGYAESRARVTASELLSDPDISRMVEERLEDLAMSSAEATKRMADIARGDIGQFFKVVEYEKDGEEREALVLDKEAVIKHGGGLVKSISFNESGRPKLKMYDAQKALRLILKAHGAFNHKQEHELSGPDGGPIQWGPAPTDEAEPDTPDHE